MLYRNVLQGALVERRVPPLPDGPARPRAALRAEVRAARCVRLAAAGDAGARVATTGPLLGRAR